MSEFLVRIAIRIPASMNEEEVTDLYAAESRRSTALAEAGHLVRIWRVPGSRGNIGIWRAEDATELHVLLASLPLFPYMEITVEALATHPHEEGGR